jgi:hypothetical protein
MNSTPSNMLEEIDKMAFLDSGDARETSEEIIKAIHSVASGNDDEAERIWEAPIPEELIAIWEAVTKNGLIPSTNFVWGHECQYWANPILQKA